MIDLLTMRIWVPMVMKTLSTHSVNDPEQNTLMIPTLTFWMIQIGPPTFHHHQNSWERRQNPDVQDAAKRAAQNPNVQDAAKSATGLSSGFCIQSCKLF